MTDRQAGPARGRPSTLEELITALNDLGRMAPVERAAAAPGLAEAAKGILARVRGDAVAEAVESGLSQAEVARRLGISNVQVSRAAGRSTAAARPADGAPRPRGRPRKDSR
jgi:hypothetical protein